MASPRELGHTCDLLLSRAAALLSDFRLDEPGQVSQRLLPAEIAGLRWNGVRYALLNDVEFGADRDFLECHCHLNLTRQVGVVELVCVTQAFMGYELNILAAERVAVASGKIPERHPEGAADFCVQFMHGACKAIGRQPFGQRIRLKERAIDLFGSGCQDAMQKN